MSIILFILIFLFVIELFYFKIANHFNIIDKPNSRSSHAIVTIRGGGIIFSIGAVLFFLFNHHKYPYFMMGLFLISLISFLDDILTLNNKIRLTVHLLSVMLVLSEWGLHTMPFYLLFVAGILIIGTINAYNFMDGINGITGVYSFVAILTLYYINGFLFQFVAANLLIYIGLSLLVFNFFNFRIRAKCFAGDVGSISIAFIIVFLMGQLMIKTENYGYILFLLIYGLDVTTTILFRLIRKENIFEAHRSHFYQYLVNEKKVPHLYVSGAYGVVQLVFNIAVIKSTSISLLHTVLIVLTSAFLFIGIRFLMEGPDRLLKSKA